MSFFLISKGSLFKFCDKQWNIADGCNTLRVGTLSGFRQEENEKLRDEDEGRFEFTVEFPRMTKVSPEWLEAFNLGNSDSLEIGGMEFNSDGHHVKSLKLSGADHDCWVFCVSMSSDSAGNISENYESKWRIPAEEVKRFALHLAQLLRDSLSFEDVHKCIPKRIRPSAAKSQLKVEAHIAPVEYGERRIMITNESELSVPMIHDLKRQIAFRKPEKFKQENEFRFVFRLFLDDIQISVPAEPRILQLRPIDEFVRLVNTDASK